LTIWTSDFPVPFPRTLEVVPPPVLGSVTPSIVLADRATPVTIRGANLRADMTVVVESAGLDGLSLRLLDQRVVSDTTITGSLPGLPLGESRGPKRLFVLDQGRQRVFPGLVTYVAAAIDGVEPATVGTQGGTQVTFMRPASAAARRRSRRVAMPPRSPMPPAPRSSRSRAPSQRCRPRARRSPA
jgi:hypothetical protein